MKLSLVLAVLLILFLAVVALTAQDVAKEKTKSAAPVFSAAATDHILIAYHKALEAQLQAGLAQRAAQDAANAYQTEVAKEAKAAGMPDGTTAQVDTNWDAVTPIPPPAPAKKADKPEKK
jgi:hypothetical protein